MSRCIKCGKHMQNRRDFCSENCSLEYFVENEPKKAENEEENDD